LFSPPKSRKWGPKETPALLSKDGRKNRAQPKKLRLRGGGGFLTSTPAGERHPLSRGEERTFKGEGGPQGEKWIRLLDVRFARKKKRTFTKSEKKDDQGISRNCWKGKDKIVLKGILILPRGIFSYPIPCPRPEEGVASPTKNETDQRRARSLPEKKAPTIVPAQGLGDFHDCPKRGERDF